MSEIINAEVERVAFNPYRRLHAYPYLEDKITALIRSIEDVGLWPSCIAREVKGDRLWRYELAFGHHRLEASKRMKLARIPLIVMALSDKQMLQYMGRENLEDYNAAFLIQLESWEAALKSGLVSGVAEKRTQHIDAAKLLGWTRIQSGTGTVIINDTASACHAAYALIEGGYMAREDFADLSVRAARNVAETAFARMQQIDKVGTNTQRSHREIEAAKQQYGRGAVDTANQIRAGSVTPRDIRSRVDFNAAARNRGGRPSPLFAVFANAVAENLRRTINTDADAEKLANIEKALPQLNLLEDWEALRRLDVELLNLAKRAEGWQKRLIPTQEKVVHFRALERKE